MTADCPLPTHAYVPGQTPRHAPAAFDALKASVRTGMAAEDLTATQAWRCGWRYMDAGFFWEAHELFEPVWMVTRPNSRERHLVQALIQIANAGVKELMQRPRAVSRLCDLAEAHLQACAGARGPVMGVDTGELETRIAGLRRRANP